MEKEKITSQVIELLADSLCVEPDNIDKNDDLTQNLGADSLDILQLRIKLEDEFHISINDADLEKIKTVQDIIDCVLSAKKASV